ncbi:MAG TPA: hypothetical protein VHN59_16695 [Chitinophagaceae bacterium]|nr:hypothetical protein [Chitinophagaceae bacterium]
MQKYLPVFLAIMLLASCRKQNGQSLPPPPDKKYEIVITATLFNPSNHRYEATCWINGAKSILDAGTANQAFSYGIEKKGTDVYISGGFAYSDPSEGNELLMPCYWINGQKVDLPVDDLDINERCSASDLKWFNNSLYITGDADLLPVIWKVKDGVTTIIRLPTGDDVLDLRKTGNLQVYNNQLYIGGNQKKIRNGETVFTAGYWTIDQNDRVSFNILEDNLSYALCFNIAVSAKGIFIAGEYASANNSTPRPVVWTGSGHLPVSATFNPSYHRLHTCAVDEKGDLYLNVFDIQLYQPVIWKVPASGMPQLIQPAVPTNAKGFCHTIDISIDQLAYVYMYEADGRYYAAYTFNGKTIPLDIYSSERPAIHRLKIFPQQS